MIYLFCCATVCINYILNILIYIYVCVCMCVDKTFFEKCIIQVKQVFCIASIVNVINLYNLLNN